MATNDSITSGTQFPLPGGSVDGNSPVRRSKKATRLNMSTSHRFGTDYTVDSVMNGFRGDAERNYAKPTNGREQISASETMKKQGYGNIASHDSGGVGYSTPAFGAAVRA